MTDLLITPVRAAQIPALATLRASSPEYLLTLVRTASDCIRQYTSRDFTLTAYTEYQNGGIYIREPLALKQRPVVSISRVATNPTAAIQVSNSDTINNQRATIATDLSAPGAIANVILFWVSSGVPTTIVLPVSTYLTLGQIAAAINAQNHGWSASIQNAGNISMAAYPAADLKPLQGAVTTLSGSPAYLSVWLEDVSPFGSTPYFDDFYGTDSFQGQDGWRLDQEDGLLYGRFPRGQQNIRIDYMAGYAAIPASVQEACAQIVKWLNDSQSLNFAMESARLGNAGYTLREKWPGTVNKLLAPYVDWSKGIYRG